MGRRVGSIAYQVSQIIKAHNGIGESKREARESSGLVGENGQKVSDKFHSYKSLDNVRRDLMNLGNYFREEFGTKDMSKITIDVVKSWIESKDITYRTASNYLSELNKVAEHFSFTRDEIKELREELKETLPTTGELAEITRAYENLDKVTDIINERSQIAFTLQCNHGLRVSEATHINVEKQLDGNILEVQAKGGKVITVELDKDFANKIREVAKENNGIYEVSRSTYTRDLRQAVESVGNEWKGTHGVRHTFAQEKLEEGYTKAQVSEMLGHNREEITDVYLR